MILAMDYIHFKLCVLNCTRKIQKSKKWLSYKYWADLVKCFVRAQRRQGRIIKGQEKVSNINRTNGSKMVYSLKERRKIRNIHSILWRINEDD